MNRLNLTYLLNLISLQSNFCKLALLALFLGWLYAGPSAVLGQSTVYAHQLGFVGNQYSNGVEADSMGNSYHILHFTGTMDVDPGPAVLNMTGDANGMGFVLKLDPFGNLLWAKKIPTNDITDLKLDWQGNILLTGNFSSSNDFDPGPGTFMLTPLRYKSAFVLKLDSNGNFIWANKVDGAFDIGGVSLTSLPSGSVYLSGSFSDTIFSPFTGLPLYVDDETYGDGFLAKFSSTGAITWVKHYQCFDVGGGPEIEADSAGNIYTLLFADGILEIAPGGTIYSSLGYSDVALVKLDSNGTQLASKFYGTLEEDYPGELLVKPDGNVLITFTVHGTLDSVTGVPVTPAGTNGAVIILESDPQLNPVWHGVWNGSGSGGLGSICLDPAGNICGLASVSRGTVDFDLGAGVALYSGPTLGKTFLGKYSPTGQLIYLIPIDYTSGLAGYAATDQLGGIVLSGYFNQSMDADIFSPVMPFSTAGDNDIFMIRLDLNCGSPTLTNLTLTHCGAYNWNGNLLTSSGIYYDTLLNSTGCDSVISLNLTVNQPSSSSQAATFCDSYIWPANGQTYTSSGSYSATLMNSVGCDSVVTLNLTIQQSNSGSESVSTCEAFTWSATGQTYASSGVYTAQLLNAAGCDSVATLNLTLIQVDTAVAVIGNTLEAQGLGGTYQWLDCNAGYAPISGANGLVFSPVQNGTYALAITQNGCTDTSGCHTIVVVGLEHALTLHNLRAFPNPTNGRVTLQWTASGRSSATVLCLDVLGRVLIRETVDIKSGEDSLQMNLSHLSTGTYFLRMESPLGDAVVKIWLQE